MGMYYNSVDESDLRRIIKKTLNESKLLLEKACNPDNNVTIRGKENWVDCGGNRQTCKRNVESGNFECLPMDNRIFNPGGGSDDDCCLFWNDIGQFCVERDPACDEVRSYDKYRRRMNENYLTEEPGCQGWWDCPTCGANIGSGSWSSCQDGGGNEVNSLAGGGECFCIPAGGEGRGWGDCEDCTDAETCVSGRCEITTRHAVSDRYTRRLSENNLNRIVNRVIRERSDIETEYEVGREHVCVKGNCYDRRDTDVPCGGDGNGNGGKCFKSGRKCRKNC